jgi:hypothetical protein
MSAFHDILSAVPVSTDPPGAYDYWDEHPDYPLSDWQELVAENTTRQGYWEWVNNNLAEGE